MTIRKHSIQLAKAEQLERMFEHMERTLLNIGFLEVENPKRIMRVLRRLLGRSEMEEREVQILQGILSKMDWHIKKERR
jgi:tRNA/rRNA methyltransferase